MAEVTLNPTFRIYAERAGNQETQLAMQAIREAEGQGLTGSERNEAIDRVAWGLERYRAERLDFHTQQLEKAKAKYERKAEKNAAAESVKFQRLQARINAMSDDEVKARAEEIRQGDSFPNGDEVDLLSARLRQADNDVERTHLREAAEARRAWQPWTHEGDGAEHADALEDIGSRQFGHIRVEVDGGYQEVPIESVADFDNEMESVEPA